MEELMSKLYIANCTRQEQEVQYRLERQQLLPGQRPYPAMRFQIPRGRQAVVGGDLPLEKIQIIVEQLRVFGLKSVDEVKSDMRFTPYVFDVDRPVKVDVMRFVIAQNDGIRVEEGKERRVKAAVATNDLVTKAVTETLESVGIEPPDVAVRAVEFEQVEQSEAGEKRIEEGFKLDANAPPPASSSKKATAKKSKRRGPAQAEF
jgi:hypothetical protein